MLTFQGQVLARTSLGRKGKKSTFPVEKLATLWQMRPTQLNINLGNSVVCGSFIPDWKSDSVISVISFHPHLRLLPSLSPNPTPHPHPSSQRWLERRRCKLAHQVTLPFLIKWCVGIKETNVDSHRSMPCRRARATCNSPQPQPALQGRKKYDQAS